MSTYRIAVIETEVEQGRERLVSCGLLMNKTRRPYEFATRVAAACFAARSKNPAGVRLQVVEIL